jgi:poly-gamma-glutamate capsule biosynthesis protein CapA/YwtB (metallophosphatase superfamily)
LPIRSVAAIVVLVVLAAGVVALAAGAIDRPSDEATTAPEGSPPSGGSGARDAPPSQGLPDGEPGAEEPAPGDDEHVEDPEDEPPSADTGTIEEEEERQRLVIHHVGDVNLDPAYVPVLRDVGFAAAWDGARDTFAEADLVMVNLECAATEGGTPQPKQFVFRCALDGLGPMREAGVDVATLANNHSGDYGIPGMVESRTNVEAAGMDAVGVGEDEADAYAPRILELNGWRIAIIGFGGVVPVPEWTARGDLPGQPTGYDPNRMAEAIEVAAADADLVIATVHWGNEGALEPRPEDRVKADAMIEAGVDVVFGHHAHRLQPLERVDGVPVFWNLGNFVWPRHSAAGATTAVAEYVIEPDGEVTACLIPFEIDATGTPHPTGESRRCS